MMDTLKVKLLTGRSGPKESHMPGETITLPSKEAIALVDSNQAEYTNKKAYLAAKEKVQTAFNLELENEVQVKAILEKEKLEAELNGLYNDVVLKEAALNGVVLNDEQILEMVEELKKRILPVSIGA